MNKIMLAVVIAVTVEGLIEYAKTVGKAVQSGQRKTAFTQAAAIVLGVLLCLAVGADVYSALGIEFALPWIGTVLTGSLRQLCMMSWVLRSPSPRST